MTGRILTFAFLMSILVYGVVAFFAAPDMTPAENTGLMQGALAMAAAMSALAIPVMRKVTMGHHALTPVDDTAPTGDPSMTKDEARAQQRAAMARYQVGTIVGLALAESVAIYGLVLAFMSADGQPAVPFLVAGAVLILAQFPREACAMQLLSSEARAALRGW